MIKRILLAAFIIPVIVGVGEAAHAQYRDPGYRSPDFRGQDRYNYPSGGWHNNHRGHTGNYRYRSTPPGGYYERWNHNPNVYPRYNNDGTPFRERYIQQNPNRWSAPSRWQGW
jgi:hypothetical protein